MPQIFLQNKLNKTNDLFRSLVSRRSSITNITLMDGLTTIGYGAFEYCSNLVNISIPNSVTVIDSAAFYHCSSLTNLKLPNNLVSIGGYAFSECNSLGNITIPSSVTQIGFNCLSTSYPLNVTFLATSPPSLGNYAFGSSTTIYVPAELVDTYKTASGWSDYASRIQAIPS